MIGVALAILGSTAVGVAAERRYGPGAERFAQRLMTLLLWVLLPPLAFLVVSEVELGGGVGAGLLLGYVELAVVGLAAYAIGSRALRLSRAATGSLIVAVILANTGYLGLPLCTALLGRDHLGEAVTWDVVVSGVMLFGPAFAVGAAFGTTAGDTAADRARAFVTRNPVLPAVILGFLAPDMPDALVDAAELVALLLLPVGFFVLGVHLTHEAEDGTLRIPPPMTAPVAVAVGLRLVAAPLLLAGLSAALLDVPDAYLLQAAMPSGINALVVAHVYGLDIRLAAGAVAWTTGAVVIATLAAAPFV